MTRLTDIPEIRHQIFKNLLHADLERDHKLRDSKNFCNALNIAIAPECAVMLEELEDQYKKARDMEESAWDKYRFLLLFETSVLEVLSVNMQEADNLLFGGRRIKTLLETLVERPLNRWIFENYPDLSILAERRLIVGLGQNSLISVVEG